MSESHLKRIINRRKDAEKKGKEMYTKGGIEEGEIEESEVAVSNINGIELNEKEQKLYKALNTIEKGDLSVEEILDLDKAKPEEVRRVGDIMHGRIIKVGELETTATMEELKRAEQAINDRGLGEYIQKAIQKEELQLRKVNKSFKEKLRTLWYRLRNKLTYEELTAKGPYQKNIEFLLSGSKETERQNYIKALKEAEKKFSPDIQGKIQEMLFLSNLPIHDESEIDYRNKIVMDYYDENIDLHDIDIQDFLKKYGILPFETEDERKEWHDKRARAEKEGAQFADVDFTEPQKPEDPTAPKDDSGPSGSHSQIESGEDTEARRKVARGDTVLSEAKPDQPPPIPDAAKSVTPSAEIPTPTAEVKGADSTPPPPDPKVSKESGEPRASRDLKLERGNLSVKLATEFSYKEYGSVVELRLSSVEEKKKAEIIDSLNRFFQNKGEKNKLKELLVRMREKRTNVFLFFTDVADYSRKDLMVYVDPTENDWLQKVEKVVENVIYDRENNASNNLEAMLKKYESATVMGRGGMSNNFDSLDKVIGAYKELSGLGEEKEQEMLSAITNIGSKYDTCEVEYLYDTTQRQTTGVKSEILIFEKDQSQHLTLKINLTSATWFADLIKLAGEAKPDQPPSIPDAAKSVTPSAEIPTPTAEVKGADSTPPPPDPKRTVETKEAKPELKALQEVREKLRAGKIAEAITLLDNFQDQLDASPTPLTAENEAQLDKARVGTLIVCERLTDEALLDLLASDYTGLSYEAVYLSDILRRIKSREAEVVQTRDRLLDRMMGMMGIDRRDGYINERVKVPCRKLSVVRQTGGRYDYFRSASESRGERDLVEINELTKEDVEEKSTTLRSVVDSVDQITDQWLIDLIHNKLDLAEYEKRMVQAFSDLHTFQGKKAEYLKVQGKEQLEAETRKKIAKNVVYTIRYESQVTIAAALLDSPVLQAQFPELKTAFSPGIESQTTSAVDFMVNEQEYIDRRIDDYSGIRKGIVFRNFILSKTKHPTQISSDNSEKNLRELKQYVKEHKEIEEKDWQTLDRAEQELKALYDETIDEARALGFTEEEIAKFEGRDKIGFTHKSIGDNVYRGFRNSLDNVLGIIYFDARPQGKFGNFYGSSLQKKIWQYCKTNFHLDIMHYKPGEDFDQSKHTSEGDINFHPGISRNKIMYTEFPGFERKDEAVSRAMVWVAG